MSLGKKRRRISFSVLSLCFPALMRANSNQLGHLILLQWRSPPGMVVLLKDKLWYRKYWETLYENSRRQPKKKRRKNSFSLFVFAYLEEKTMKQCSPVIQALGFRGKGLDSRPVAILSLSNISNPCQAFPEQCWHLAIMCWALWTVVLILVSALRLTAAWPRFQHLPCFSPLISPGCPISLFLPQHTSGLTLVKG